MSSRALILAAVLFLLVGSFTAGRALAQENLDAGKSPSQIFAGTCNACHKSPRGLLKTVSPSSLPGFLRQHYTTSPNMAGVLSSYLISNGATDTRMGGDAPKGAKGAKEAKDGAKEGAKDGAREGARLEARPVEQLDRWGRRIHPGGAPEAAAPAEESKPEAEAAAPAQAAVERASKMSPKQKLGRRGKPGEALPKEEPTAAAEPKNEPKNEAKSEPKGSETATREEVKPESKPEPAKPAEEGRAQSVKIEQPSEAPAVQPDPVPPVTPAAPTPPAAPAQSAAAQPAPAHAAVSAPVTEMAVPLPAAAVPPPAPAVSASAPPQAPVPPAGPPVPPISQ
jgi:hypothetical protein